MTIKECYAMLGGNYDATVERLCSERLVQRFLEKFLDDGSYADLLKGVDARDGEIAFRAAHSLKGVALNLGLDALFGPASALAEQLRHGWDDAAFDLLPAVKEAYERTVDAIHMWQESNPA